MRYLIDRALDAARAARHALRMPLLRQLRRRDWYRQATRLPRNEVLHPLALVDEVARARRDDAVSSLDQPALPEEQLAPVSASAGDDPVGVRLFATLVEPPRPTPFVARLHEARVVGKGVAVLDAADRVLDGATVYLSGGIGDHGVFRRFWLPPTARVDGTTVLLSSPGGNTYYHWLLEVLPRLELLRLSGVDVTQSDHVALNSFRSAYQRETLERLGIDARRVIATDELRHARFERLVVPAFAGVSGFPPRWVCDFLARSLPPAPADPARPDPELLYVSRQGGATRRLHDADTVERVIADAGFTTIFPERLTVAEQARLFRGARVVVGVHGSGFTNLVFCRPGATVVELFQPGFAPHYFWVLARRIGLRWAAVMGTPATTGRPADAVVVRPDDVARALASALGASAAAAR
jgi:capsular polysaccharide biosynthesis protein